MTSNSSQQSPRTSLSEPTAETVSTQATRAQTPKSVSTQERIRAAAARVLSHRGIATARLSDIAAEAGVQAPAIYYYYESREDLIEDVIRTGQVGTETRVTEAVNALDPDTSAIDKICVAVEAHLRALHQLSDYTTAAVRNVGQMSVEMRDRLQEDQRRYGRFWKRLFVEGRERGEIRPELDLRTAQLLVVGALNWTTEWFDTSVSVETLVATARDLTRHGLSRVR